MMTQQVMSQVESNQPSFKQIRDRFEQQLQNKATDITQILEEGDDDI